MNLLRLWLVASTSCAAGYDDDAQIIVVNNMEEKKEGRMS
eukprot:CAMPEP_0206416924 /NCGR_PEP_ID=MMETSP0294-20121207/37016_1 /ASSEMBLY_ACC=CAM_ASM_000327 /TAXON_ID=39354 /ORGANISM="Heterosigma akashiwo, Strain CCMP2393" /LENGTH=39 /DNA_ID= /DNA_START= /DNA_END= /DNA_ORIENTATION=